MTTITQRELDAAIARFTRTFQPLCGTGKITVQMGSKTYGRAYRVHVQKDGTGGLWDLPGMGSYLGMTRSDAERTLHALCDGWNACEEARVRSWSATRDERDDAAWWYCCGRNAESPIYVSCVDFVDQCCPSERHGVERHVRGHARRSARTSSGQGSIVTTVDTTASEIFFKTRNDEVVIMCFCSAECAYQKTDKGYQDFGVWKRAADEAFRCFRCDSLVTP